MNRLALAHAAAAIAALSAGTAVVVTRFVVGEIEPLSLVFYRYLISVICFLPLLPALWPRDHVSLSAVAKIGVLGILFFVLFPWAFNASLAINPAARGAVGLATIPIQTLLVAAVFGREQLSFGKVLGVLLAFCGIAIAFGAAAFGQGLSDYLRGDALMLLGVLCAAVYSVFSRPTLMRYGALFVTALGMMIAVVALVPVMAVTHGGMIPLPVLSTRGWVGLVLLGTVSGTIQFSLFMWALRSLPPTTTVLYLTLNPLTAMVLGIVLLGEVLAAELVVGVGLVLTGILINNGLLSVMKGAVKAGS